MALPHFLAMPWYEKKLQFSERLLGHLDVTAGTAGYSPVERAD